MLAGVMFQYMGVADEVARAAPPPIGGLYPHGKGGEAAGLRSAAIGCIVPAGIRTFQDFPQRISYQMVTESAMKASVEGASRGFELRMRRTACGE